MLFERLPTHDPAPKVTLKSNWHSQQQQQYLCDYVSTSTKKLVTDQSGIRDVRGYTTDYQTSTKKLVRDSEPVDDKKRQFEIDLRVEVVCQDAILQDEEKMRDINKKLLDPAVQEHFRMVEFQLEDIFLVNSSSTWTESPTWWSSSSWDHQWQERHSQGWQDKEWWDQR